MTVRTTIIAFTVPLFMLLACVNGALLYVQDKAEMTRALDAQAMAAAITTAQFLSAQSLSYGLDAKMLSPQQMERLSGAAANIAGLERLAYVRDKEPDIILLGSPVPRTDEHIVSASAPVEFGAGSGGSILAHIDAMPMHEKLSTLKFRIALLVMGAGLIGAILGWFLGRRISRELNRVLALIDGFFDGPMEDSRKDLTIRETIDLSNAVHLMSASMRAARSLQKRQMAYVEDNRSEDNSVQSYRKTCFAPLVLEISGAAIAIRMLGLAPAGSFYAIAQSEQEAAIFVGLCEGDSPARALANALSAQDYFERNILDSQTEKAIELGRSAFSITGISWAKWKIDSPAPRQIMALLGGGDSGRADAYHALHTDLAPDMIIDDLAALLKPAGVIAAIASTVKTG